MAVNENDFGIVTIQWSEWQTLLAHVRQMNADGASYREEIAALQRENAALKTRVNDLVEVVKEQQAVLAEQSVALADFEAQKQELLADVATVRAAFEKASDGYARSRELAKQNDALGAGAPGNGIKAAAVIDGIRVLLSLAEKVGVPHQAMLYLLSFCIKLAEMPEGKMDEFMTYFTGGHDNRAKESGGRARSVSETMLAAQVAAFYATLKERGVPPSEAMRVLASACDLSQGQQRKIRDIGTRVAGSKDPTTKRFYREAEMAVEKMTGQGVTPMQAVTGFLRELFEQDPTLLAYIQKSKS
jgi:hypothetical protein